MKKSLAFILLFLCVSAQAAETITAHVNGMVCAFCAQGIEKKVRALPQTEDVYVNLQRKVVAVQLKQGQHLADEAITTLIKDAGYDVTKIERADDTTAAIRARMEQP